MRARVPIVAAALISLAACDAAEAPEALQALRPAPAGDAGYVTAPAVTRATLEGREAAIEGRAEPEARVRLATPGGEALFAEADGQGRWRLNAPLGAEPSIYGLSMIQGGRRIQAQSYVVVTPRAEVVLLRSGSGAVRLDPGERSRITTVDYDADGGMVVSGVAPPNLSLTVRIDGRDAAEGRVDAAGRFSVPLATPIARGQHRVLISGDSVESSAIIAISPPQATGGAPFRSRSTGAGLQVDWMTPGGGVQTTLILN
jgi:hypothetical protein